MQTTKHRTMTAVLMTVGLAFYWPFFRRFEFSLFFSSRPDSAEAMWWSYGMVMASCLVFAVIAIAAQRRIERFVRTHRAITCGSACVGTAGYLMLLLGESLPLVIAASVMLGFGYVALTCLWAVRVADRAGNLPLIGIAASFPISAALSLVILLPEPLSIAVTAVAPAVSAFAWLGMHAEKPAAARAERRARRPMPLAPLGIFCLFIIIGHLIVGALYQTEGFIPVSERLITAALSTATMLLVAYLIARSSSAERVLRKGWVLLAVFYLAATFLVLYAGSDLYHLGAGIIQAELNCFEMCFWILLVLYVRQTGVSPVRAFGVGFLALKALPVSVAKLFLPSFFDWLNLQPADYTATFVAAMTFMLVVITVVFLNARAFNDIGGAQETGADGDASGNAEPTRVEVYAQLAAEGNLTPRETEVLSLVAQGHSLKRVGELLFISTGTVQGHTKNLYRKLDVHSKQELIDLVNARCAQVRDGRPTSYRA
ncbi:response regulator transcription factor [Eggerthella sinensis]|uniref:response regulator transcription factor n=1 Tax=Eggerthella sinensis TaxID=242230 RepID=UPI00266BFE04|nr:helix-turn-helix transcriptional regulator [Eggerthella sinensis]